MKIAIHHNELGFSKRWIEFCRKHQLDYVLVDCFSNKIVEELRGIDILLWNWRHDDYKSKLIAQKLIYALERIGIEVFPSFPTIVNYDDKLGQKYQFESLNIPHAETSVFFNRQDCEEFIRINGFPFVAKSRGGAGASNVYLVRSQRQFEKLCKLAFGKGYPLIDRSQIFLDSVKAFSKKPSIQSLKKLASSLYRLFRKTEFEKYSMVDRGYILTQEFMPNNDHDIRIIVIGNKAFGIKRLCRDNDFRASGSGSILYGRTDIDVRCVKLAFEATDKLQMQCAAFDFVKDKNATPVIIEVSYTFSVEAYDYCEGYFNRKLEWIESSFNPQEWMLADRLSLKND